MWFCRRNAKTNCAQHRTAYATKQKPHRCCVSNCRETVETGLSISRLVCFNKAWIWSPFMIDETLMRSCKRSNSMTWLRWEWLLRGISNTAAFLLKDLLEGYEIQWGAANDKIFASVWPSMLAGNNQSSVRAVYPGGASNIPMMGSCKVRGGERCTLAGHEKTTSWGAIAENAKRLLSK